MMNIDDLSTISINLNGVSTSNLVSTYSPYLLYIENRTTNNDGETDFPKEYNYNLYEMFRNGVHELKNTEFIDGIIISEPITATSKIIGLENYNIITNEQFSSVDDVIDYDSINSFERELSSTFKTYNSAQLGTQSSSEISASIYDWLNSIPGLNFDINRNPENADNSNLILTHRMKNDIQKITESILTKIFRNLMQLIRSSHDYRLYGSGTTIFGGKSTDLSSTAKVGEWSGLPQTCWTEYRGKYIVGKTAYGENVGSVGSGTIKNSTYDISPYTSYMIAPHTHNVDIDMDNISSTFSKEKPVWKDFTDIVDYAGWVHFNGEDTDINAVIVWNSSAYNSGELAAQKLTDTPKGFVRKAREKGSVISSMSWNYSWNSNSGYCQLLSPNGAQANIFNKNKVILPTYSSYVWKWTGKDNTNITSPSAYLRRV